MVLVIYPAVCLFIAFSITFWSVKHYLALHYGCSKSRLCMSYFPINVEMCFFSFILKPSASFFNCKCSFKHYLRKYCSTEPVSLVISLLSKLSFLHYEVFLLNAEDAFHLNIFKHLLWFVAWYCWYLHVCSYISVSIIFKSSCFSE